MTAVPEVSWVCQDCGFTYGPLPIRVIWVSHECKRTSRPRRKQPEGPLFLAELPSVVTRPRSRRATA